jgi:hypothetical protein
MLPRCVLHVARKVRGDAGYQRARTWSDGAQPASRSKICRFGGTPARRALDPVAGASRQANRGRPGRSVSLGEQSSKRNGKKGRKVSPGEVSRKVSPGEASRTEIGRKAVRRHAECQ